MCNEIDNVTQAIEEGETSLLSYARAIKEIDWSVFDLIQERISDVTSESEFLIELMSNKDLFDDKGKLTSQGAATMGLHALNYNTSMYQADEYGAEVAKLDKQIASDPYDQELINRRNELLELQRESILAAEDEKQAIKSLLEDGYEKELDSLSELIDAKNESLQSEKDLYEYQKKVSEQTENIASLRKQMTAYEGDNSQEAAAKIQELRVSLAEAETELQETEWDKYIQDTEQILDTLFDEAELILNQRLDNVDFLLQQVIDGINTAASLSTEQNANLLASLGAEGTLASALGVEGAIASAIVNVTGENGSIKNILNKEVGGVGTTLSNAMNNIWSVGDGNAKSILTTYGTNFQNQQTTTNGTLNGIKVSVDKMVAASNKEAEKKVAANKTSSSAKKDPTKDNKTPTKTPIKTPTKTPSKTQSKSEKDYYGVALAIWNGNYGWGVGDTRKKRLKAKGFDAAKMQTIVNKLGKDGYVPTGAWQGKYYGIKKLAPYHYNKFAKGAKNIDRDQWAWTQEKGEEFIVRPSDGAILTPVAKSDSVLNANASGNIWDMANNPADFIKDNLKLGVTSAPNNSIVQSNCTQHFDNITFSMPNVKNYGELLSELQRDPKFEKLILAMTLDQVVGKSSLAKGKSIR